MDDQDIDKLNEFKILIYDAIDNICKLVCRTGEIIPN